MNEMEYALADNKQDNKPKEKTYTQDEVNKILTQAVDRERASQFVFNISKNMHPGGNNVMTNFTLSVSGGRLETLETLIHEITILVIDHHDAERMHNKLQV